MLEGTALHALVDHLLAFARQVGLERELGHLHEVGRRRHAAGRERQTIGVERQPVREVRLPLHPAQQVDPVLLLRVVGDQLFHRVHVGVVVALLRGRVEEKLQAVFGRRAAGALGGLDLDHQLLGRTGVVAAQVLALDQHRPDRAARAALAKVALAPLHRLGVLLRAVVAAGDRLDHAKLLGRRDAARAAQGLVGARRRLGVAGARRRGQAHALDEIRLVGVACAGRLGVAHLGERLAVAAGLDQLLRRLQGLADLGAQALLRARGAAETRARATTSAAATPARSALLDELFIADHSELGDAEALRRREHGRDRLVFDQLVGPDVHLGLIRLGGGARQARLERAAVRDRLAVPQHGAVEVDVDRHDHRLLQRRRRRADRHVEVDAVQLDRDRDDQHDDQDQHHVDQRRGVDVHHDVGLAAGAVADAHCHGRSLSPSAVVRSRS